MRETIRRNRVRDGIVYVQMTRGVARRDLAFPPPGTAPSLVVTARSLDMAGNENKAAAKASRSSPFRKTAGRGADIKSISLLPNVLAKQAARDARRRAKPGSSTRTGGSPRAPPAMPGSSPGTARSSPGRPITEFYGASPEPC